MVFVRALAGEHIAWGIGKQTDRTGDRCTVQYFDAPSASPINVSLPVDAVAPARVPEQTRVYHFDISIGAWEIGRLLDDHGDTQLVQFPNKVTKHLNVIDVFTRWARPIVDPTLFLANHINESPRFSDGRSAFRRSQLAQRAASLGMSALLSSAIELESHQIDVVRRILQDPVQRYLLADEVGLGKTIEAGILIRQCVLDCGNDVTILIVVPDALVLQWHSELSEKFLLGDLLGKSIQIVAMSEVDAAEPLFSRAVMLVVDEAHHLIDRDAGAAAYAKIAAAAASIERVLLLSATPVLHNERGFLAMLHILDPANYPLDSIEAFRAKILARQPLAEIVAGLVPENALYLDHMLDALVELFPDDGLLQAHVAALRAIVEQMPDEEDPALIEAIGKTRAHLSEVYRLNRRILRHRRRNVAGLTPDRAGAVVHRYRSADRRALTTAMEDWKFAEAVALGDEPGEDGKRRHIAFSQVLDRASQYAVSGAGMVGFLARRPEAVGNIDRFTAIARTLERGGLFEDRARAMIAAMGPMLEQGCKCVVFCSDSSTANALADHLRSAMRCPVDRHSPQDNDWDLFNVHPDHRILVCDRRAEEGLNLQGGRKVVVHYDTPLNPNRLEQRLGRVDRYGSGESVRSILLLCEDDPLEEVWTKYLDGALKIFDRSVASLQYLIDATVRSLPALVFDEGHEALEALVDADIGDAGRIEKELKAIDQQDALDALGAPPSNLTDLLCDVDDDWRQIADDTTLWLEQTLMFGRLASANQAADPKASPFRYTYATERGHTLLPLPLFLDHCSNSLDFVPDPRSGRAIKSVPFSFQRRTVLSRDGRETGVRLLRYGEPFLTGIGAITDADDRGRSFALWREDSRYDADQVADVFLRFDFLADANLEAVHAVLAAHGRDSKAARAALRRRGDLALAPSFSTVWLDSSLNLVPQGDLRAMLGRPYGSGGDQGRDVNINARRWQRVRSLQIDCLAYWTEFCAQGRVRAEEYLREDPDFVTRLNAAAAEAATIDYGRISQMEIRIGQDPSADSAPLELERAIAAATREGILRPQVRLETIGAVFMTGSTAATDRLTGGL